MDNKRKEQLEKKGWRVGSVDDFLQLTEEEKIYIEMKLALGAKLRAIRTEKGITQENAAKILRSSQSRFSKMEAGDPSVSLDLQIRSLLALGATKEEIAESVGCS